MDWGATVFFPKAPAIPQAVGMQKDVEAWYSQCVPLTAWSSSTFLEL